MLFYGEFQLMFLQVEEILLLVFLGMEVSQMKMRIVGGVCCLR